MRDTRLVSYSYWAFCAAAPLSSISIKATISVVVLRKKQEKRKHDGEICTQMEARKMSQNNLLQSYNCKSFLSLIKFPQTLEIDTARAKPFVCWFRRLSLVFVKWLNSGNGGFRLFIFSTKKSRGPRSFCGLFIYILNWQNIMSLNDNELGAE